MFGKLWGGGNPGSIIYIRSTLYVEYYHANVLAQLYSGIKNYMNFFKLVVLPRDCVVCVVSLICVFFYLYHSMLCSDVGKDVHFWTVSSIMIRKFFTIFSIYSRHLAVVFGVSSKECMMLSYIIHDHAFLPIVMWILAQYRNPCQVLYHKHVYGGGWLCGAELGL